MCTAVSMDTEWWLGSAEVLSPSMIRTGCVGEASFKFMILKRDRRERRFQISTSICHSSSLVSCFAPSTSGVLSLSIQSRLSVLGMLQLYVCFHFPNRNSPHRAHCPKPARPNRQNTAKSVGQSQTVAGRAKQ